MEIKNARGRRATANIYEDFRGIDIEDYLSPEEIKDIRKDALYEKVRNDMPEKDVK